ETGPFALCEWSDLQPWLHPAQTKPASCSVGPIGLDAIRFGHFQLSPSTSFLPWFLSSLTNGCWPSG
uniref:Uncharacterized protein n=1 Tax=Gasterosteus aculeatus aculeatus TaxID=481459 RepID=A0AAQ4PA40_GASAC